MPKVHITVDWILLSTKTFASTKLKCKTFSLDIYIPLDLLRLDSGWGNMDSHTLHSLSIH